jgi:peptidoglycan/LPS O-acetylase OafA/YrhL
MKNNLDIALFNKGTAFACKGMAILFVIFTHISNIKYSVSALPGAVGVCIFLVLSGYGLHKSFIENGLNSFWLKRLSRLFFPYWIMVLALAFISTKIMDMPIIISQLFMIAPPPDIHGWFLQHLVMLYFGFYVCFIFIRNTQWQLIALLAFCIALFLAPCSIRSLRNLQLFSFVFGVLLSFYEVRNPTFLKNLLKWQSPLLFGGMGLYVVFLILRQATYNETLKFIVNLFIANIAILGIAVGLLLVASNIFGNQILYNKSRVKIALFSVLGIIGAISYEIYLTHGPLQFLVKDGSFLSFIFFFICVAAAAYTLKFINSVLIKGLVVYCQKLYIKFS